MPKKRRFLCQYGPKNKHARKLTLSGMCNCGIQAVGNGDGDMHPTQEPTGLPLPTLQWVGGCVAAPPQGFDAHPFVKKLAAARR